MRFILSFLILLASMFASIGAVNYPARTNGNNTFHGTNFHVGPVIIGNTNWIANIGSRINKSFFTNGSIYLPNDLYATNSVVTEVLASPTVNASLFFLGDGVFIGTPSAYFSVGADSPTSIKIDFEGLLITKKFLIRSNTVASIPTLLPGDNFYWSSNGVPHLIWQNQAGTQVTNRLVP